MIGSLEQMADHFYEVLDTDFPVNEVAMHPADFPEFYEQNKVHVHLSGAPWLAGEIVGSIWGASIRLSNSVLETRVRVESRGGTIERNLFL